MNQAISNQHAPDMLDAYDFSEGVRGKYAERYHAGTNLVRLDDVAEMFPDAKSVNDALRALGKIIAKHQQKLHKLLYTYRPANAKIQCEENYFFGVGHLFYTDTAPTGLKAPKYTPTKIRAIRFIRDNPRFRREDKHIISLTMNKCG